jgi:hypothetical protein
MPQQNFLGIVSPGFIFGVVIIPIIGFQIQALKNQRIHLIKIRGRCRANITFGQFAGSPLVPFIDQVAPYLCCIA